MKRVSIVHGKRSQPAYSGTAIPKRPTKRRVVWKKALNNYNDERMALGAIWQAALIEFLRTDLEVALTYLETAKNEKLEPIHDIAKQRL